MNVKQLIAAAAVFSATASALAQTTVMQTGEYIEPPKFVSTKTRAEVIAELNPVFSATASALAQTAVVQTGEYIEPPKFVSTKTRAEVIAELHQARAAGMLNVPDHEFPIVQATSGQKTRDEVRAELAEYLSTHPNGVVDSVYLGG